MFELKPVAHVRSPRVNVEDDNWDSIVAEVVLEDWLEPESLLGLDTFSHAEILYIFHRVEEHKIELAARHPRNNPACPKAGIFAQRGKNRPNRLGATIAEIVSVAGRTLTVRGLDAIDGTPVMDIKPVMREFLPRSVVRQPAWSEALMEQYWFASPRTDYK